VNCDDPAGWRRGARMNLRALAAADPDKPERQRNCGVAPVGSQVEIRIKDGSAYYSGLETCGNVWLCPVCSAKIHHRRASELRDALASCRSTNPDASLSAPRPRHAAPQGGPWHSGPRSKTTWRKRHVRCRNFNRGSAGA
jgi:hypothetical protein